MSLIWPAGTWRFYIITASVALPDVRALARITCIPRYLRYSNPLSN